MELPWSEFKTVITGFKTKYIDRSDTYFLFAYDGQFVLTCKINKIADTSDVDDFEDNFKTGFNKTIDIVDTDGTRLWRPKPLANTDNLLFRGTGFAGTATKDSTTNIDYELPEERFITGASVMCKNHVWGDHASLQVVDVENILGFGAGLVLNEFATSWYMIEDSQWQGMIQTPYPAKIIQGLYLRIVYHSVGTENDVLVNFNWFFHKKQ